MKVDVLSPKGYCAGVARAIGIALKARQENLDRKVYVLGMLVHNHHVSHLLESNNIQLVTDMNEIENGQVIVFNADGHTFEDLEKAEAKKLLIYDAACPKVESNLKKIMDEIINNHQVIYIGQKNHHETQVALSLSEDVILYDVKEGIDYSLVNDDSPFVLNQTTLNSLEIVNLFNDVLSRFQHARISNEICPTTRQRQEAILNVKDVDAIIVVGDKVSSNSNRLFEIAQKSHPDIYVSMISGVDELDINELRNKKHIAISSGASTPSDVVDEIYNKLISL